MKTSKEGMRLIMRWEKFSPTIYICPAGWPTIGYGHVVKKEELFPSAITEQEAEAILAKDIFLAERSVGRLIKVPLNQNQFDALVSFTFNLGGGALQRSTLRSVLNRGEYNYVPAEFRKWVYAGGRKLSGLIKRRNTEAILYATGELHYGQ